MSWCPWNFREADGAAALRWRVEWHRAEFESILQEQQDYVTSRLLPSC